MRARHLRALHRLIAAFALVGRNTMDETGVMGLLEELSILLEDAKPVFGKNTLRQVYVSQAF